MRTVQSDIEGFTGKVFLKDKLFWEDVVAIENALDKAAEVEPSAFWKKVGASRGEEMSAITWTSKSDRFFIEALLQCAERFEIKGMEEKPTLANFPMTPRILASKFVGLLWGELQIVYNGENNVPNDS